MALSLSRGLMRFVGGRISKSGGVKIRTPVATMGIRGDIALIEVINEKTVDVTLLYGTKLQARQRADRTSKSVAKAFSHASKRARHQQIL